MTNTNLNLYKEKFSLCANFCFCEKKLILKNNVCCEGNYQI